MIKSENRSISYVSSHISSQARTHREKNKDFPAEELRRYMKRLFAVSDYENTIEFAKAESRAEGVNLGVSKAKLALKMLKDGLAIDQICKETGLAEDQVAELQALL